MGTQRRPGADPSRKNPLDLHQSQEQSLAKVGWACPPPAEITENAPEGIKLR